MSSLLCSQLPAVQATIHELRVHNASMSLIKRRTFVMRGVLKQEVDRMADLGRGGWHVAQTRYKSMMLTAMVLGAEAVEAI